MYRVVLAPTYNTTAGDLEGLLNEMLSNGYRFVGTCGEYGKYLIFESGLTPIGADAKNAPLNSDC